LWDNPESARLQLLSGQYIAALTMVVRDHESFNPTSKNRLKVIKHV